MDRSNLFSWQWSLYPAGHRHRMNLVLHVLSVPFFWAGAATLIGAPLAGHPWLSLAGLAAMVLVMALQGRGHRMEAVAPVPFEGPADVARRILAEQFVTFPRYVFSGEFARAWRESKPTDR